MRYQELGIPEAKAEFMKSRLNHMLELTMTKVAAHITSPSTYPLPDDEKSAEHIVYKLYQSLPQKKQATFISKTEAIRVLNAAQMQQRFGDLAAVDFKSTKPCFEQIREISIPATFRFTEAEKSQLKIKSKQKFGGKLNIGNKLVAQKNPAQPIGLNPRTLSLILDNIHCVKTQDVFKDEISIVGFTVDALGQGSAFGRVNVGKIKKGETKQLGITLKDFDLRAAGTFPQNFLAGYILRDKDLASEERDGDIALILGFIAAAIFEIGFGMMALSTIPVLAPLEIFALLSMLVGVGLYIFGFLIPAMTITDSSTVITDNFVFDIPPVIPVGTAFSRQINSEIRGSLLNIKGNYQLNTRWERTA